MERRIRPWINKKIIEYIGEEEATLVDFVCSKVDFIHSPPSWLFTSQSLHTGNDYQYFLLLIIYTQLSFLVCVYIFACAYCCF